MSSSLLDSFKDLPASTKLRVLALAAAQPTPAPTPVPTLTEWTLAHRLIRGSVFSFDGHEYLREIYSALDGWYEDTDVVIEKAAQMGASEWAISAAFWFADVVPGTRVIYWFPTDTDVADFSRDRITAAIADSEHLQEIVGGGRAIAEAAKRSRTTGPDVDNVHLKSVRSSLIYFRGMFAKRRAKSIPADFLIFDELDEAPPNNLAQARERMSHSPWKWVLSLSTPSLPDFGIDVSWRQSDQRFLHLECGCREGTVLEDNFPECIGLSGDGQDVWLRCPKCGKERLDPCWLATVGEYVGWIPRYPEKKAKRGYHLSQLFSTAISTRAVWTEFTSPKVDIAEFHNSKLGLPYAGDRVPLTRELLAQCHGDWPLAAVGQDVCIGIDQGDQLHIVVTKPDFNTGLVRVLNARIIEERDPWPEAYRLIDSYVNATIVIDALPNKADARRLVDRYKGRAWMCYYSDQQKDVISQDSDETDPDRGCKVTAHRTETLDRVVDAFKRTAAGLKTGIVLPHASVPINKPIYDHLCALAKIKRPKVISIGGTTRETGEYSFVYIETGPDHFAHAINYSCVAQALYRRPDTIEFWGAD